MNGVCWILISSFILSYGQSLFDFLKNFFNPFICIALSTRFCISLFQKTFNPLLVHPNKIKLLIIFKKLNHYILHLFTFLFSRYILFKQMAY